MYGVVTRDVDVATRGAYDLVFYEVKDVTGRSVEPLTDVVNMISCFADNQLEDDEDLVPVDDDGKRATRERPYFDWSYVCPTDDEYREDLLNLIEATGQIHEDVRLDDVGFPRDEYCHCERCERQFRESGFSEWCDWRNSIITRFVASARVRVPGRLYLTLYPDPYPERLSRRCGIDLGGIEPHVDEFVVPLYDMAYATTYWLEIIAQGFHDLLDSTFDVELYAPSADVEDLVHAAEVVGEYGSSVLFAYGDSNARAAISRLPSEPPGETVSEDESSTDTG